jgi:hypothetical protein
MKNLANVLSFEYKDFLSDHLYNYLSTMRVKEIHIHEYEQDMFQNDRAYDIQVKKSLHYDKFIKFVNRTFKIES